MQKLFVVLLGGKAIGANVELHDVVFVVGETIEETYPKLVNKWFGITKSLHIDSFYEVCHADGYKIEIHSTPDQNQHHLWFINFGGYHPGIFGETHESKLYVAKEKKEAVQKAKAQLCKGLFLQHCDDRVLVDYELDDCLKINHLDSCYIHCIPSNQQTTEPKVISEYRRLDVPEILEQARILKPETECSST